MTFFSRLPNCFPKWMCHFVFPPSVSPSSDSFPSSFSCGTVNLSSFTISVGGRGELWVLFTCFYLVTHCTKEAFTCSGYYLCIFLDKMSVQSFCSVFNQVFFFFSFYWALRNFYVGGYTYSLPSILIVYMLRKLFWHWISEQKFLTLRRFHVINF